MTELLEALCRAVRELGHPAELASSTFPVVAEDLVYVLIPHEHRGCEPPGAWPTLEQRERTIALCVENPPSPWFETVCQLAHEFPAMLAINQSSADALRRRAIEVEHLQLGYAPEWDLSEEGGGHRPIDVTYLGSADERRDALIANYGQWWSHRQVAMLVPTVAPKPAARADYLVDSDKYRHLSRSKLLVNLHRDQTKSFEWVRVLQAMANGCVVVSEPSLDHAPLVAGEHFVAASAESLPHVVEGLLHEPDRISTLRSAAYEKLRQGLTMASAAQRLVETADRLLNQERPHSPLRSDPPSPPAPSPAVRDRPERAGDDARTRAAVRGLVTETIELRRAVQRLLERSEQRDPDAQAELVASTPAFDEARPRISVAVTLRNYEREVVQALDSVDISDYGDYEVIVIDDDSSDRSLEVVRDFLIRRPWMPATLLRNRVNQGLGASRNALALRARGEFMFVLDADNTIFPSTLRRLADALDRDPGATFAYPLIAVTRSDRSAGLLSRYAWDREGFRSGNYIDAMATDPAR